MVIWNPNIKDSVIPSNFELFPLHMVDNKQQSPVSTVTSKSELLIILAKRR